MFLAVAHCMEEQQAPALHFNILTLILVDLC